MKDIYVDICRINILDPANKWERMCKVSEESGELAQAVNKTIGRKIVTESREEVLALIKEEAADTIQCVLSLLDTCEVEAENVMFTSLVGDCRFNEIYGACEDVAREMIALEISKGKAFEAEQDSLPYKMVIHSCDLIMSTLRIAGFYGITLGEVLNTIKIKNLKWESVINKRRTV